MPIGYFVGGYYKQTDLKDVKEICDFNSNKPCKEGSYKDYPSGGTVSSTLKRHTYQCKKPYDSSEPSYNDDDKRRMIFTGVSSEGPQSSYIDQPSIDYLFGKGTKAAKSVSDAYPKSSYPKNGEYKIAIGSTVGISDTNQICDVGFSGFFPSSTSGNDKGKIPNQSKVFPWPELFWLDLGNNCRPGSGYRCAVGRQSFKGNEAACCLRSTNNNDKNSMFNYYDTTKQFTSKDKFDWSKITNTNNSKTKTTVGDECVNQYTCDPKYRTITMGINEGCYDDSNVIDQVSNICAQRDSNPNLDSKIHWRDNGACTQYASGSITGLGSQIANNTLENIKITDISGNTDWSTAVYVKNVLKYADKYDETLIGLCKTVSYQQVKDAYTYTTSKQCNSADEKCKTQLLNNENLYKACGCFLQSKEYAEFGSGDVPSPECDPICMLTDTKPTKCGKCSVGAICTMSDISITDINSTGNIDLTQNCKGGDGKSGTSICNFDNVKINEINSQGKINISANCSSCRIPDENGIEKIVPCESIGPDTPTPDPGPTPGPGPTPDGPGQSIIDWIKTHTGEVTIIVFVAVLTIIVLLMWLFTRNSSSSSSAMSSISSQVLLNID